MLFYPNRSILHCHGVRSSH